MTLISAKQANLLVKNTEKYKKALLAEKISKDISDAAMMGQQQVDISYGLTEEVVAKLVELGYTVYNKENKTTITW
jgi:hypothetical protein